MELKYWVLLKILTTATCFFVIPPINRVPLPSRTPPLFRQFYRESLLPSALKLNPSDPSSPSQSDKNPKTPEQLEIDRLLREASSLRSSASELEKVLVDQRRESGEEERRKLELEEEEGKKRRGRVVVFGANGEFGAVVVRTLLREYPSVDVVASVHDISDETTRGYGRLSYMVGAEDGIGTINPAWSDDKTSTFEYDPVGMKGYNLQNCRIVECEILDPRQVETVVEGCDACIFCASDFKGNRPRAISTFSPGLLFRGVVDFDKGRVEVDGVKNVLSALEREQKRRRAVAGNKNILAVNFVYITPYLPCFRDFPTTGGSFKEVKTLGENIVLNYGKENDLSSVFESTPPAAAVGGGGELNTAVMRIAKFSDDFPTEDKPEDFVITPSDEDLSSTISTSTPPTSTSEGGSLSPRRITRLLAARACVEVLFGKEGGRFDVFGRNVEKKNMN